MRPRQFSCARVSPRQSDLLIRRHARQIGARSDSARHRLEGVFALSFRPGDRTSSFADKLLRPVGQSVAIVLEHRADGMPLHGHTAHLKTDGHLSYQRRGMVFHFDGMQRPRTAARAGGMNARSNPELVELVLEMDRYSERCSRDMRFVRTVPMLPRIKLGFAPSEFPAYEVTEGLRQLAAMNTGISIRRLATNPPQLVERLLEDTWQSVLVPPSAPDNPTDLLLVDAEYCTQASRALRVFEDLDFPTNGGRSD